MKDKHKRVKHSNERIKTNVAMTGAVIFIILGSLIFMYPIISNYVANINHTEAIREYQQNIEELSSDIKEKEYEKAKEYNENLSGDPVHDPFVEGSGYALPDNYIDVLNIAKDGIMSYIDIPKISVKLPIYHGTSEEVLEKGVGHIESTSLPIGGNSTHCVLTGHTGLASAELFTKLDKLIEGDIFYLKTLNEVLTYKVYETKVILPNEIDELQIEPGKDLVTLVTCTPYGVNTHRLLVKANQVEYEEYIKNDNKANIIDNALNSNYGKHYLIGIIVALILLALYFGVRKWRKND